MKEKNLVFTAVCTAVLSTSCCLPAFLYLFFGVSVGGLSFLQEFEFLRIPLALLSICLLILFFAKNRQTTVCSCNMRKNITRYIYTFSFSLLLATLLLYPEFAVYFVE